MRPTGVPPRLGQNFPHRFKQLASPPLPVRAPSGDLKEVELTVPRAMVGGWRETVGRKWGQLSPSIATNRVTITCNQMLQCFKKQRLVGKKQLKGGLDAHKLSIYLIKLWGGSGVMFSGHVFLSAAYRHIPNSAKKVKQSAGPEQ